MVAEDIEVFRSEGALDKFEECHTELGEGDGIDVRLEAGGTLFLRCGRLVVSDAAVERFRKGKPRPHHGEFTLELELSAVTFADLRGWLGIPPELSYLRQLTLEPLAEQLKPSEAKHATLVDAAGHTQLHLITHGNRLGVSRGKWATDELWSRVWSRGKRVPGVTGISSRNLVSAPDAWPEQPPPKPAPRVWPNVYGVTCDFAEMTLSDLRRCLGLPPSSPFVFTDNPALDPHPALTLGEAARHGGRTNVSGDFQDEQARPLIHCFINLRESALSFRRQDVCDDDTWLGVWRAPEQLPGVRERHSRTTRSPPDPWPAEPPARE